MIVTLARLWITNVVTGDMFSYLTDPDRTQSYAVASTMRTYAAGRQRAVGTVGTAGQWAMTLVELMLTDVNQLYAWLDGGATLYVRDHRGQAQYATFFQMDVVEKIGQGVTAAYTVKITFQQVDVVEGI